MAVRERRGSSLSPEEVERDPLCGFRPDSGKSTEGVDQRLDRSFVEGQ